MFSLLHVGVCLLTWPLRLDYKRIKCRQVTIWLILCLIASKCSPVRQIFLRRAFPGKYGGRHRCFALNASDSSSSTGHRSPCSWSVNCESQVLTGHWIVDTRPPRTLSLCPLPLAMFHLVAVCQSESQTENHKDEVRALSQSLVGINPYYVNLWDFYYDFCFTTAYLMLTCHLIRRLIRKWRYSLPVCDPHKGKTVMELDSYWMGNLARVRLMYFYTSAPDIAPSAQLKIPTESFLDWEADGAVILSQSIRRLF